MNKTVRKMLGVVLILIGVVLSLSIVNALITRLNKSVSEEEEAATTFDYAYAIGSAVGVIFFGVLIYYAFKEGAKLLRNPPKKEDTIDKDLMN